MTDKRLYETRTKALNELVVEHSEVFKIIRVYANIILLTNSGSKATIGTYPFQVFQKMFVSYHAQRIGFREGCRPFIGIDGTWLKTSLKGCLLIVISIDANNGIFPIAAAICEGENDKSWARFLIILKEFLNLSLEKLLHE